MALGAQSRDVLWLVLGKGTVLVGIGALLGGFGAYGVSRLLISLIPSLSTDDPLILPFAALALVAVALVEQTKTWITEYNEERPHESLRDLTPREFLLTQKPEISTHGWS
jgi:hypothetical protein